MNVHLASILPFAVGEGHDRRSLCGRWIDSDTLLLYIEERWSIRHYLQELVMPNRVCADCLMHLDLDGDTELAGLVLRRLATRGIV